MAEPLTGQVAIVTGAGRGIGAAIAGRLHADGATVMVADLDPALADAQAARLGERTGSFAGDWPRKRRRRR